MGNTVRKFTKAKITEKQLFWHFGVALGFLSSTVKTSEDLEKELDSQYTKEEILELLYKPVTD
jgi:hypothetical protein